MLAEPDYSRIRPGFYKGDTTLEAIRKIENITLKFERAIMMLVGLLLPSIITVGVFFRYVLKSDLYAIEEIEIFLAIWFYFMGAAYASYRKSQITADILQVMIKSASTRKTLAIVATGITFAISAVFAYWCVDMLAYAWAKQPRSAVWKIPLIAQYFAVFAGLLLMSIYALRDFVSACRRDFTEAGEEG